MQQIKENIIKDADAKSANYYADNYLNKTQENYRRRHRNDLINQILDSTPTAARVFDAGCGPMILYPQLLSRCEHYCAFDLVQANLDEIENAHAGNKKVSCINNDLDTFVWDGELFDVVVCSGTLEYHAEPQKNLLKMLELLRPGGIFVASFPTRASPYRLWSEYVYNYAWYLKNKLLGKPAYLYPRKLFSVGKLERLCRQQEGVRSVESHLFGGKIFLQPLDRLLRNLDLKITKYCDKHNRGWMKPVYTEFLLIVRK